MIRTTFFFLAVTAGGWLHAAPPPMPKAPLVQPMLRMPHFILSFEPTPTSGAPISSAPAKNPNELKSVEITITGAIEKVETTMNSGTKQVIWMLGPTFYGRDARGRIVTSGFSAQADPGYLQPNPKAYYGTEWIDLQNYQGIKSYNGVSCYYYAASSPKKGPMALPPPDGQTAPSSTPTSADPFYKAWINVETNQPFAVQVVEGVGAYQILAPPTDMLQPPEDFILYDQKTKAAALQRLQNASVR